MSEIKYPIGGYAPGDYWHKACKTCGKEFTGDKRAWSCESCGEKNAAGEKKLIATYGYEDLFDYLSHNHGLNLLQSEMSDLIHVVHKFHPNNESPAEQPVADELEQLRRWKKEATLIINPIMEYAQGHKDAKLGSSLTEFMIDRCKELDRIKAAEQPGSEAARVPVFVPCTEDDPDCCGAYTSNEGRSLCYVKEVLLPLSVFKETDQWIKATNTVNITLVNTAAKHGDDWISVDERLPELTEPFIVYNDQDEPEVWIEKDHVTVLAYDNRIGIYKAKLDKSGWSEISSISVKTVFPTHWRPLPQPPAPGEKEANP